MKILLFGKGGQVGWELQRALAPLGELVALDADSPEWHANFDAHWPQIRPLGFDERFRKLWKFYLSYCEAGFRTERTSVVQLSLAKA